jgi:hypothetical protein
VDDIVSGKYRHRGANASRTKPRPGALRKKSRPDRRFFRQPVAGEPDREGMKRTILGMLTLLLLTRLALVEWIDRQLESISGQGTAESQVEMAREQRRLLRGAWLP